ncbi:MAG: glutamate-5-semialdehyde dehydrogenase [Proteobacteria bacterium]|nr:glutamate-5-semialdehyde dehydrogenase [Pseudomonadota bacterium]
MTERRAEVDASIAATMNALGQAARTAARGLAVTDSEQRNAALLAMAAAIRGKAAAILEANETDMRAARERGLSEAMLDRLMLDGERVEAMAVVLKTVSELPDPVGKILAEWQRPNGLKIQRVAVPLGVIGMIYESRPNVTVDAAALCVKSGNAVILRGGSESFLSSQALHNCIRGGLIDAGITPECVQMVPTRDRAAVGYLLASMSEWVDVVIPRGGKSLLQRVRDEARVPVIGHLAGVCHVYLHSAADADMAREVVLNAKMRRTGVCGAAETILVDRMVAATLLPDVCAALSAAGCEIRGDETVRAIVPAAVSANSEDWAAEYLDAIVAIRVVDDIDNAIAHIVEFGSGHTESIVTNDDLAAEQFFRSVDSAIVLQNASTQFADGGEFGMGTEIGIATGRIHARGPVGAEQLTSYKYIVRGNGQVRP